MLTTYDRNSSDSQARSRLLPEDYIQQVLGATDIASIIGEHVKLRKAGSEFVGLCPFHQESSPSFSVNPSKGVYLCRGCDAKGNVTLFLKEHLGMEFVEAMEMLAKRVSLPSPSQVRGSADSSQANEYRQLLEITARASKLYQEELSKHPAALKYLHDRGVTPELITEFAIGYAPPGGRFLLDKMRDTPIGLMEKAGLVARSSQDDRMHDFLSYRIIFPVRNNSGQTIGFGGRSLSPQAKRKYLNTTETPLFRKGHELYGWFEASRHIHKAKSVIVTEGYVDSVIPSGHGIKNIVSCMGAVVQSSTLARLFKAAENVVYCFDGDEAGRRAARRAMEQSITMVDETHRCSFVFLPNGFDPDEYVLKFGADKFRELVKQAEPLSKFMIRDISSRHDMTVLEGRAHFAREAMQLVNQIQSPLLRLLFTKSVGEVVGPDVPLDALDNSAGAADPASKSAPAQLAADSARSLFGMRKGRLQAEQKIAPPKAAELPSPGLRVIAILSEVPQAAEFFDPDWLAYAPGSNQNELNAARAIVAAVKEQPELVDDAQALRAKFEGTPTAEVIEQARVQGQEMIPGDLVEELGQIAHFLMQRKEKDVRRKNLFRRP